MISHIKKYWRFFKWCVVMVVLVGYFFYQPPSHKERVELNRCIDGDTATFFIQQEEVKVRFLLIDTPELSHHDAYSQEAKDYTCRFLQEAKMIELENDGDQIEYDKYGRRLAWVFGDGRLLQEELALEGYVVKLYDYGHAKRYNQRVRDALDQAKKLKKGLYAQSEGEPR